jgi:hypothetical protein
MDQDGTQELMADGIWLVARETLHFCLVSILPSAIGYTLCSFAGGVLLQCCSPPCSGTPHAEELMAYG